MTYPIDLDLRGRRVVVVGGGRVAAYKTAALLDAGAQITVISPALDAKLIALGDRIDVRQTAYASGMLDMDTPRPLLVFAATDSRAVNAQVAADARALGILVNTADHDSRDFTSMATVRRGAITIGIGTGGAAPMLALHLREQVAETVSAYGTLAAWMGDLRAIVQTEIADEAKRRKLWRAIIESPIVAHLQAGDEAQAREIFDALFNTALNEGEAL